MTEIHDYDDRCADYEAPDRFVVMAYRSAASIYGSARVVCKDSYGDEAVYRSYAAAAKVAKLYNDRLTTPNVRYEVERY